MATRKKGVKKGVQFTIMVVGQCSPNSILAQRRSQPPGASGTGRTTFVNTLCESIVLEHKVNDNPETAHVEEGIKIKPFTIGNLPGPLGCLP